MIRPLPSFGILGAILPLLILLAHRAGLNSPTTPEQNEYALSIHFPDLNPPEGQILLRIQNKFQDTVHQKILPVSSASKTYTCSLEAGSYAVAAFHDINSNEELDRQWSGFPDEPYGFSNNVQGTLGPPDLKDQLIPLQENRKITIRLR